MNRCLMKAPKVSISRWWVCCSTVGFVCLSSVSFQIAASTQSHALTIAQAPAPERLPSLNEGGRPILRSGSRGADVNELQATLKLLGFYDGAVDGFFGETTVAAVGRFQEAAGLGKDGVVGPATWERLFPPDPVAIAPTAQPTPAPKPTETAPPKPTASQKPTPQSAPTSATFPILRKGITGDAVRGLQERLRSLGLFEGAIDGVFGEATETAVKAAQRKYQLDPDGVVGPGTWSALLR